MKNKYVFVAVMLFCILVVSLGLTTVYVKRENNRENREDNILVVTSFYPMYIATENIIAGAKGVELKNLSEPQTGCLHDFQLTPEDMRLLSEADVFVINGGGIESFVSDIAKEYPNLLIINASEDISFLEADEQEDDKENNHEHEHEDFEVNAHAWMSISSYRKQLLAITEGLMQYDRANADLYDTNQRLYDEKLQDLQEQFTDLKEALSGKKVILFHEAYAYLTEDLGMECAFLLNLDEETAISAGDLAKVMEEVREHQVSVILAEALYGSELGQLVSNECDVEVLYLDTLNRGTYEADSYLKGMQENLNMLSGLK